MFRMYECVCAEVWMDVSGNVSVYESSPLGEALRLYRDIVRTPTLTVSNFKIMYRFVSDNTKLCFRNTHTHVPMDIQARR